MDTRRVVIGAAVVSAAATVVAGFVLEAARGDLGPDDLWGITWAAQPLVFAISGATILWRRPGNSIGRLLLVPAIAHVFDRAAAFRLEVADPLNDPVDLEFLLALLVNNLSWTATVFPVLHLLLVFPTGRLLGPRWRFLVALELALITVEVGVVSVLDRLGPIPEIGRQEPWNVANPIGLVRVDVFEQGFLSVVWPVGLVGLLVGCVVALAVRYRRSGLVERQQIKWLLGSAGLFGVVYVAPVLLGAESNLTASLLGLAVDLIPVAVMIAVLRYRLFEIDRLISRTVGYALVAALVAAIYTGSVLAVSALLPQGANDLAVAASTLTAFALVRPLRRATAGWVDRRFDRTRYDSARTVGETAARLSSRLGLDDVVATVTDVTEQALHPESASVWIRPLATGVTVGYQP